MKKKERVKKTKNEYEAEKLERRAMRGMDRFPEDQEDAVRRLRVMMEQFDREGKLTGEEREKIFGPGGYLEQAEQAAKSPRVVQVEVPAKRSIWHRAVKWASVAAIFCVSIVVLTMSSEANREYVKDTVSYYVGDDVVVKSSGGKDNVIRGVTEAEMRDDIKETLNMDVPAFRYKPEDMEFDGYTIYENDKVALIYYMMKDKMMVLTISEEYDAKQTNKIYNAEKIDTIPDKYHEFSIEIFENLDKADDSKVYYAKWEKNENSYTLVGMKEKDEFYKILKKMSF